MIIYILIQNLIFIFNIPKKKKNPKKIVTNEIKNNESSRFVYPKGKKMIKNLKAIKKEIGKIIYLKMN